MNLFDIYRATESALRARLREMAESERPAHLKADEWEPDQIRAELSRRYGGCA